MATNSYQNDMQLKWETQSILHRQKQNTTGAVLSCHNSLNEIFGLILYDRLFSCVFVAMTVHHFPPGRGFWLLCALQLSRRVISGCKSNIKIKSTSSQSDYVCFVISSGWNKTNKTK